jgi:hypothetical protein
MCARIHPTIIFWNALLLEALIIFLVTKNIRHFPPKVYAEVKIVRIREFLRVLEQIAKT